MPKKKPIKTPLFPKTKTMPKPAPVEQLAAEIAQVAASVSIEPEGYKEARLENLKLTNKLLEQRLANAEQLGEILKAAATFAAMILTEAQANAAAGQPLIR